MERSLRSMITGPLWGRSIIHYLTSKLMIEGCNASRELARFFSGAKEEHRKALYRFVGYLKEPE